MSEAAYIAVARVDDIPRGTCRSVEAGGRHILVAHLADGFYAVENRCSHAGSTFDTKHAVKGGQIVCLLHGALFDVRTGLPKTPPAFQKIATFAARIVDGRVEVAMPRKP